MILEATSWGYTISIFTVLVIPFFAHFKQRKLKNKLVNSMVNMAISFFCMSIIVVAAWYILDLALDSHLNALDRDGDTIFSKQEQSTWSKRDWQFYDFAIGDGGRNVFAVFVFPVFAACYSFIIIAVLGLIAKIRGKDA